MTTIEPEPTAPPPHLPFQFSLRALLLLFVVLASSLAVFGGWGLVVFGLVVGVAICVREVKSLTWLMRVALVVLGLICLAWLLRPIARQLPPRSRCTWNLVEIAAALQDYHKANGCFPPAYIADKTGKPMHSWRVLILPYMGEEVIYRTYDFTQPWDSPKNKNILTAIPVFACPCDHEVNSPSATQTSYVAVLGPNTGWAGVKPTKLADFGGEASRTIMLVEVANSGIDWTEPRDLSLDTLGVAETKSSALVPSNNHGRREEFLVTYDYGSGVNVAMADGSVGCLRLGSRSLEELQKLLQIGGFKEEEIDEPEMRLNWPNIAALAVWLASVGTLLVGAVRGRKARPPASSPG